MQPANDPRLAELLAAHEPPCVSLYLPTRRAYPDAQQNAVTYRNLLRDAEAALRERHPGNAGRDVLERLTALADDADFWNRRPEGTTAVFAGPGVFLTCDLPRPVPARATVADSFHVKPLVRRAMTADRFQVLCLTRNRAWVLEGDRDALHNVDAGAPKTVEEALGVEDASPRKEQQGRSPHAGDKKDVPPPPGRHPKGGPAGHPAEGEDEKIDAGRFFQAIDKAVWERHSRPSGLPLVLAALPANQAMFRAHAHNQYLLPAGVEHDPEALREPQLREAAWAVLEPWHRARVDRQLNDFQVARSRGQGSDDLAEVAKAAHAGRVHALLLDADRRVPGRLDPDDGHPRPADGAAADAEDLLDDLGELVLRMKGVVFALPSDRMPSATGVAAVFRY